MDVYYTDEDVYYDQLDGTHIRAEELRQPQNTVPPEPKKSKMKRTVITVIISGTLFLLIGFLVGKFTATTNSCTTSQDQIRGVLTVGGLGQSSAEVFLPSTGRTCILANTTGDTIRADHSLDTDAEGRVILCGGDAADTQQSCVQFSPTLGVWSSYARTMVARRGHGSWSSPAGLMLLGGYNSGTSTEIVIEGQESQKGFTLVRDTAYACVIQGGDYMITTGGNPGLKTVSKYNLQGHVEDLPDLIQGRRVHACGSYAQILVVAGGLTSGNSRLSSMEMYDMGSGSPAWTSGEPLPRALSSMASVSLDMSILIIGGRDDDRKARNEILSYRDGDWSEVGQLEVPRRSHASTMMMLSPDICG